MLAVVLAAAEVFLAKLRLFRVPELLAGSFVLALLAVDGGQLLHRAGVRTRDDRHRTMRACSTSPRAALLLAAVLIVWRRDLRAIVRLLGLQGVALAAIPVVRGVHEHDAALIVGRRWRCSCCAPTCCRGCCARAVGAEPRRAREATPLVNMTASLLVAAALTLLAFAVTRPLVELDPAPATNAVPAAFAVVLIGLFVMVTRRRAMSQAVGFLMLDNGIAATAFLTTAGVPLIVELGASLDVLFVVLVLGVLTGRLRRAFGGTDLDDCGSCTTDDRDCCWPPIAGAARRVGALAIAASGGAGWTATADRRCRALTVLGCGVGARAPGRVRRSMSRWAACCGPTRCR